MVPAETRERVVRDVLAKGLIAELSRRAGEPDEAPASQDTLSETDRSPSGAASTGTEPEDPQAPSRTVLNTRAGWGARC